MNDRVFIDTNVFVYLFDSEEPRKQQIARTLLETLATSAILVISTQVLQEFYVSVTRKLAKPLPAGQAEEATKNLSAYNVVQIDARMVFAAITLCQREQASLWDALIVRAAMESGCIRLLSEDLQNGRQFEGTTVENPFL
jgi:predicted nucleic acid-binding protein